MIKKTLGRTGLEVTQLGYWEELEGRGKGGEEYRLAWSELACHGLIDYTRAPAKMDALGSCIQGAK